MRKAMLAMAATGLGLILAGCATTSADGAGQDALPVCPTETRSWSAWINAMPGPDARRTLIVNGEVLLPDGAIAKLSAGPLDRMMPPGQRVALSVERAERAAGWQQVRLEIAPALPAYGSVIVGCGDSEVARIAPVESAY